MRLNEARQSMSTVLGDDIAVRTHAAPLAFLSTSVNRTSSASVFTGGNMHAGERLRLKREERGLSAADLGQRVGRSESAVRNQENGTNGVPPALAKKYAAALGTTAAWILYGDDSPPPAAQPMLADLQLLSAIQAGAWLAVDDSPQDDPPTIPVMLDRRYLHASQWLREVRGDSMNARNILPGDIAHLVDYGGAGVNLNTGMVVEVTRTRDGGGLREITLKEVELTPDGIVLWPRSTNPKWKDPVRLDDGTGSDIEVQITGLLLAKITRF